MPDREVYVASLNDLWRNPIRNRRGEDESGPARVPESLQQRMVSKVQAAAQKSLCSLKKRMSEVE